ncbi:MAG: hypothetical protein IKN59_07100 [Paludibacteraceae bacterium]|nr:hypothetical protein [Paludibacteraceae bacterium]
MKKIYTYMLSLLGSLFVAGAVSTATAQQLPDPGFEDWSGALFDGAIQPAHWNYCNVTQMGFNFNFSDRQQGRSGYCIRVQDKNMVVMGINGGTSPGYVALGHPWAYVPSIGEINKSTAGCYGGISWSYRPDTVTLWIKRTGDHTSEENYNILFYAWEGTSKGASYGGKDGSCTPIAGYSGAVGGYLIDEESDIRQALDANVCQTAQHANEVCEAYFFEKASYANWTQLRIPVYYLNDLVPDKCNLILSAGNYPAGRSSDNLYDGNAIWVDDVELVYSSKIQKLYVGNREWKAFNPDAPVQTYSLGNGATTIPEIYAMRGAGTEVNNNGLSANFPGRRLSASECVITPGQVDGAPTTIMVTAEDGSSTTTYQINFVSAASNNARLADIRVNGTSVSGFNAYVNTYNVALPFGTNSTPQVEVDVQDGGATPVVNTVQTGSATWTTTITVTAADGTSTQTYTLHFTVAQLSDNTLHDILVNGVSLTGFSSGKSNYTLSLPLGTTTAPTVTPVSAYPAGAQTINVTNTLEGGCIITVSVPGNSVTKTYKITYKVEASSNSSLADLLIDGTTVAGFNPAVTAYTVALPLGTTVTPTITWVAGDAYQTITFTDGGLTSPSKITVTAANGSQTIYRITFTVAQSSNCSLTGISLDGTPLATFHPDTLAYLITLPAGTNAAPAITYTSADAYQTITLSQGGLTGTSRITVKAGDGTTRVYTLRFQVTKSLNAFLKMIYLGGDSLDGFNPQTLDYNLVLTTPTAPVITVEKEAGQTITLTQPYSYGTARIVVQPEEGDANVYTITFLSSATPAPAARPSDLLAPSSNALLADILLDGVSLTGFNPTTYNYTDSLNARTWNVPAIMPVAQTYVKEITVAYGKTDAVTRIHVVAEDGISTADYQLFFPVKKLTDCTLQDLSVDGAAITFNPAQTTYNISLPYGTTAMPAIMAERKYDEQEVVINTTTNILTASTATVTVTAPSGASKTYTLHFTVAPSGLANTLTAIVVDGVGLLDLSAGNSIDVVLPYGATDMVVSAATKRYAEQSVIINPGGLLQPTVIRVLSGQAGVAETVYTLNPVRTLNDAASLIDIQADGTTLPNFKPYQYSYVLPVTTTPAITYTAFTGAQVNVTASDSKHWVAEVTSADGLMDHTYTVYFYYTADVIPSNNFNSWSNTTYNAALKPTGWMVPADLYAKFSFVGTHTFGDEVRQSKGTQEGYFPDASEGTSTVNLQSFFSAFTIAGTYPGIMTTGTLHMNLTTGGASTSSVDGGIRFRNTPDTVKLDSKPINSTRVNNWRFLFNIHQNGAWTENLHSGPYDSEHMGVWNTNVMPLNYTGNPDSINIIINSMHDENMDNYAGTAVDQQHCELRVRNLLLSYNSRLASVLCDGSPLTFTDRAATLTVSDAEYVGVPEFIFTGEVPDQEQQVTWSAWTNGTRTALIRNYAEDGSYTDYTVTQTRPVSTSTYISYNYNAQNDLTVERGSAYQTIQVNVNDTAYVIDVTAENGATQRYVVMLTLPTALTPAQTTIAATDPTAALGTSTALLADLAVDEITVTGFTPAIYLYSTPDAGIYSAVRQYPFDSVFQTLTDTLVTWHVAGTADNHDYQLRVALSDNALLSNILIGATPVTGFYEQTFDYVVQTATQVAPTPVKGHDGQTVSTTMVDQGGNVYTYFIVVRAENGDKHVYTVQEIVRTLDTNADLSNLLFGATPLTGFTAGQTNYTVNEEAGYILPDVTAVVAGTNASANVTVVNTPGASGSQITVTVVVTAEAGNSKTYTVTVNVLPSDECHLEMIYLNSEELTGFNRELYTYNIVLPIGTTVLPEIDYTKADPTSTVTRSGDTALNAGAATVVLTCSAQSGSQKQYTLNFTVAKSTDAHLAMMYQDGTALNGFDEDIFTYAVTLPYGTVTYPVVTYDKKEPAQTVVESGAGTDSVSLVVTAEDGTTTCTYTVRFTILPSDNALLDMIFLDGDSLNGFQPAEENYTDTLAYTAVSLPVVTWTKGDDQQTVAMDVTGDVVTLTVTAGDGVTTQTYTITFVRELCANNYLADLQLSGTTISGFDKDTLVYTITYPVGTSADAFVRVADITAIPEDPTATVAVAQQDENTITIMVTAQNGDVRVYVITQTITLSDNAFLKMIYLDGVELEGFDRLTFDYSRLLLQGAIMPDITAIPEDTLSDVFITLGAVGDTTYIYCVAQDGTEQRYTLLFNYSEANAGDDADIDDCVLLHVAGSDSYLAVTIRSDVKLVICDSYGQRIFTEDVPVVDPNYVRIETDRYGNQYIAEVYDGANGVTFTVPEYGKTFFAVFFTQGGAKRLAKGAKFMLVR